MSNQPQTPLLHHPVHEPSVFTAQALMDDVRRSRIIPEGDLPPLCVLEFDGDLTDWLVTKGIAKPYPSWPCFHTTMFSVQMEGITVGIIPRTIGGPYSVLIAEQLAAAGVQMIIGLTSAGRVSPELPLPCLVVASGAIRDEGTSLHYLPAEKEVDCPSSILPWLHRELKTTNWHVCIGRLWTTDAPYRETQSQLAAWAQDGVLAVEMQAASLFAFGQARGAAIAVVAMVSNAVDYSGQQFDTGTQEDGMRILQALARGTRDFLASTA
ncbi:MAG: nucleoside phosphorylase [Bryobacter sp.]|jgi:uridine phosphorylase|nr:nucleoside phosphorylase [Bryobacter sp.]